MHVMLLPAGSSKPPTSKLPPMELDDDPRSSKLTLVLEGGEGSGLLGLLGGGKGGSTGNKGGEDSELHLGKNSIRKN